MSNNQNNSDQEQGLADFLSLLTGNTPTQETEKDDNQSQTSETNPEKDSNQKEGDEFNVLQDLLVSPEIVKVRSHIKSLEGRCDALEKKCETLQQQCDELEDDLEKKDQIINSIIPTLSNIFSDKLSDLKQDILIEISIMLKQFVAEQTPQEQKLSIQVTGIRKDSNEEG